MSEDKWKKRFEQNLLDHATKLGKLEAKIDYCPDKENETKLKLDGIGQRFQEKYKEATKQIDGVKSNFKTLIGILITLAIVLCGALGTLQVQKLPKDDFKYFQKHVNQELSSIKTDMNNGQNQILIVLGDLKKDIGETKGIIQTHQKESEGKK